MSAVDVPKKRLGGEHRAASAVLRLPTSTHMLGARGVIEKYVNRAKKLRCIWHISVLTAGWNRMATLDASTLFLVLFRQQHVEQDVFKCGTLA